jgi:hypothetical protein
VTTRWRGHASRARVLFRPAFSRRMLVVGQARGGLLCHVGRGRRPGEVTVAAQDVVEQGVQSEVSVTVSAIVGASLLVDVGEVSGVQDVHGVPAFGVQGRQ